MNVWITRNGQKLGPYSLAAVQNMVDAGKLQVDDLAWYEGLPGWIRLIEIPGFSYRPTPLSVRPPFGLPLSAIRPAPVWIICLLTFIFSPLGILGKALMIYSMATMDAGSVPVPGVEVTLSDDPFSAASRDNFIMLCAISILVDIINVTGAIFLFLLRKPALYFFAGDFVIWLLLNYGLLRSSRSGLEFDRVSVEEIISFVVDLIILGYIGCLYKKGVLR